MNRWWRRGKTSGASCAKRTRYQSLVHRRSFTSTLVRLPPSPSSGSRPPYLFLLDQRDGRLRMTHPLGSGILSLLLPNTFESLESRSREDDDGRDYGFVFLGRPLLAKADRVARSRVTKLRI